MFMMKCHIVPYIAGGNSTNNYAAAVIYLSVFILSVIGDNDCKYSVKVAALPSSALLSEREKKVCFT